tara:strand:+ start:210 stop:365 length:156 start_codon:yes stop_codon:yes gene_type:complete
MHDHSHGYANKHREHKRHDHSHGYANKHYYYHYHYKHYHSGMQWHPATGNK